MRWCEEWRRNTERNWSNLTRCRNKPSKTGLGYFFQSELSLCHRCDLIPVSKVNEAALISLFWTPKDSTNSFKLSEICFEIPINLICSSTVAVKTASNKLSVDFPYRCITGYLFFYQKAAWPSGQRVGLSIRRFQVRVPLCPLAGFVLGRPEFKSSAILVNSQLVASCQLGFLILLCCSI